MANAKQSPRPLTYKIRNMATLKASCERFIPYVEARSGIFRNTGKLSVTQVPGSPTELDLKFERTVTGQPKAGEEGKIAFQAMCEIGCVVTFNQPQGEDLPEPLLNELVAPAFYLAAERCRNMITGMGYPSPAVGAMPGLEARASDSVSKSRSKPATKARQAKSKPVAKEAAKD